MSNYELEQAAIEERRAYFRAWRAANKDKTAQHRRRYWERKAARKLAEEGQSVDASQQP